MDERKERVRKLINTGIDQAAGLVKQFFDFILTTKEISEELDKLEKQEQKKEEKENIETPKSFEDTLIYYKDKKGE